MWLERPPQDLVSGSLGFLYNFQKLFMFKPMSGFSIVAETAEHIEQKQNNPSNNDVHKPLPVPDDVLQSLQ